LRIPALEVAAGEKAAVVGPSGSGKTTLLHLAAGVWLPARGGIWVDGTEVTALGEPSRRDFRARRIGMVFQEFELLEYLSVVENILLPYRISTALSLDRGVVQRAEELARDVGLGDKLKRGVGRLSQGERQRVGICRALLTAPKLLLADEPTGSLDAGNKTRVLDILLRYASDSGATLVTVTHDRDLLSSFDRVLDFKGLQEAPAA
ncbi:MAG: ATP-binding cassette domain-containing protein, partial [bacterium]|nr:ATP-binding cassette domain-containing protein [bacterium]